jgi:ATP-dependent Lon protease
MNQQDIDELPEEVRREMTFIPASTLEEVLRVALPATTTVA